MSIEKEKIRAELRERRWAIPASLRETKSRKICRHLADVVEEDETVLVYCAKEPEVETCWFIDHLLEEEIDVVVPVIEKEEISLRLSYIRTRDVLSPSTFQVPEPVGWEIPAESDTITTAVIPMLGFDRNGGRIGYGAGYYDRFLSEQTHIRTIGIAYSQQELPSIPVQKHDIRMDMIITDESVISLSP
ncbi:MAG: 5-formyltetrahydrofolate cyclo-ligase [Methanospirillum sp.]|nr:5-formyltetrahydrofolate cyclo-ligase [Methanospirillum sp.]